MYYAAFLICKITINPCCLKNTQARQMLSNFCHNILLKKNKPVNYRHIPSFRNLLSVPLWTKLNVKHTI